MLDVTVGTQDTIRVDTDRASLVNTIIKSAKATVSFNEITDDNIILMVGIVRIVIEQTEVRPIHAVLNQLTLEQGKPTDA